MAPVRIHRNVVGGENEPTRYLTSWGELVLFLLSRAYNGVYVGWEEEMGLVEPCCSSFSCLDYAIECMALQFPVFHNGRSPLT